MDNRRTSEYRKLLPFIARASGDVGNDTIGEDVSALLLALETHKTSGDHDGRYYTETEIANLFSTHSLSGDHDGRYYTETEIDLALALKADKTITLTAGNGLTGGGNLSENRTFNVVAGDGILVTDDAVNVLAGLGIDFDVNGAVIVDLTENYAWTGNHSFTQTMYAGSIMPHTSDAYDLGDSAHLWRKIWGSELSAVVFAQYEQTLLGGWFTVTKGEGVLEGYILEDDTWIQLGVAGYSVGDVIVFRGTSGGTPIVEYMYITQEASQGSYYVNRGYNGTTARQWLAGTVFANYGTAGDGRIELNAYDTPRISVFSHDPDAVELAQKEQVRIGDLLNGWGYSASTYGAAFGAYEPGKANITIDPTNGIRIRNYDQNVIQLNGTDGIFTGTVYASDGEFNGTVYASAGEFTGTINANSGYLDDLSIDGTLTLGTSGKLLQGTGTWGTDFTGSAIWNDSGVMSVGGWNNNVKQWWGGSNGTFYANGGNITLDKYGMTVMSSGVDNVIINQSGVRFYNPTTDLYQNSSIAFISTSDPVHPKTVGHVFGYSVGYENFLEVSGLGYDVITGAVSNVEVRAMSYYNAHAKLAATMPGVGDDAYLSVNMTDGDTAIATSIDLFADRVNIKNGVMSYTSTSYPEYRGFVYTGSGEADTWNRVARVTIDVGTYAGASFEVEWAVGTTNWGQSHPKIYTYTVRCVRSGSSQDDTNAAYIEGNDSSHLRVVKTATGVFEIQVKSGYQYSRNHVTVRTLTNSRTTFDFGVATAVSGTIYTPNDSHANRVVMLSTPANLFSNKTFTVNTTTTYDVNSYGVPTTARMVYIRGYVVWATGNNNSYITFEKYGTSHVWLVARAIGSDVGVDFAGWVGVDSSGRLNVKCFGASTAPYSGANILAYME